MPLIGQAKTDYQREYMRRRRSNTSTRPVRPLADSVRPEQPKPVRPKKPTMPRPAGISNKGR